MRKIGIFYGLVGNNNSAAITLLEILKCHKQCLFHVLRCFLQSASFFILLSLVVQDMNRTETIDTEGHFRLDWIVPGEFKSILNNARTEQVFSGSQPWTEVIKVYLCPFFASELFFPHIQPVSS